MKGLLAPEYQDVTDGYAEVRETFKLPSNDVVAGMYVLDGKIVRSSKARVLRSGVVMFEGGVKSLKRFKDDAREVTAGMECGMAFEGYQDMRAGDVIECYRVESVQRSL